MSYYPDKHHPCFFLVDALNAVGAQAEFVKDERTLDCWGMKANGNLAVWLIDNRHPHEAAKEDPAAAELLRRGVLVMCAQKPDAERVGGKWLPLAVTPGYRPPEQPIEKLYDVGFVGYVRDAERMQVLSHVARHFKLHTAQGVFGDSAVAAYWQSKVGLNIPTGYGKPDAYDSANMRCFEILATGTPLITPHEGYFGELGFMGGEHCMFYRNANELIDVIQMVLADKTNIGVNGSRLAQQRHTYAHRATQVLEWLK